MTDHQWPDDLQPVEVRVARQTDQLAAIKRFYCEGLGLPVLSEFTGHDGYDGLIVGLPGRAYHLEFLQHEAGSPGTAPNKESLLVFYIPNAASVQEAAQKLIEMGYSQVVPQNPWWRERQAIAIEDPDGWQVILQPEPTDTVVAPEWKGQLQPTKVRFVRQTDQLSDLKRFYVEGLQLNILAEFSGNDGYDGLIIGLPDEAYQQAFVHRAGGSPGAAPSKENLLVFYTRDAAAVTRLVQKLVDMGCRRVHAENPWWERHQAITIEDPDGWRIVLMEN